MTETVLLTGTITRLVTVRGFGFLTDENGDERFLHVRDLVNQGEWLRLKSGDRIVFEPRVRPPDRAKENALGVQNVRLA